MASEPADTRNGLPLTRKSGLVLVKNTPKGRAVFTSQPIPVKRVIDTSPVLILPLRDLEASQKTLLNHYTYNWTIHEPRTDKVIQTQAIALGLGSLFNHSSADQNVSWERDLENQVLVYRSLRDIEAGEELCINYGRVWFDDADAEQNGPPEEVDVEMLFKIEIDL